MTDFKPAAAMRPRPCVGALMDIPSGEYHVGMYGDMILNGGFSNFMGIGGRGNTFKSVLSISNSFRVLERYEGARMTTYDTELTASWARLEQLSKNHPGLDFDIAVDSGRIILTSSSEYSGNEWWKIVRQIHHERVKNPKEYQGKTPFLNRDGSFIYTYLPYIQFLDSISLLQTDAIDEIYEKNEIDAAGANTDALRGAAIKTRMVMQVPGISTQAGLSILTTAHIGDEVKMDPYAPAKQQLASMKKGVVFKNVPEKFTFLTSNCWIITEAHPLINKTSKASEYPRVGFKEVVGDSDLKELTLLNVRNKFGPDGHIIKLLVSQSEGLLPHLSEFHYLKTRKDKFGLIGPEGVGKDYRLAIYPDVLIKRTEARPIIDADPRLQRALEITSELCQIYEANSLLDRADMVDPAELYQGLKDQGYDWGRLLDTRGYWTFNHYEHPVPPLSTMDLINMYHKRYVPFWYESSSETKKEKSSSKKKDKESEPA